MISNIPAAWWCEAHQRHLAYPEWKSGGCWWCDPSRVPRLEPTGKNDARIKLYEHLRNMPEDERRKLMPHRAPGPGYLTYSQKWLAEWARTNPR